MKKLLLIVLSLLSSLCLLFAFAACGEKEPEGGDTPPADETPDETPEEPRYSEGLVFYLNPDGESYCVYRGSCTDTDIVIPPTYEGKKVTAVGERSFNYEFDITSVTIPEGVTHIGEGAFSNSLNLKSVVLPSSLVEIATHAFAYCKALQSIVIPEGVTSIEGTTFADCTSLTSVTIPSGVAVIGGGAFSGCTSLASIEIPNGVEVIGRTAFYGCNALADITLPDSVTSVGEIAFEGTAYYNKAANWTDGLLYVGNHLVAAKDSVSGTITIKAGTRTIADKTFENREGVTEVALPAGLVTIGVAAFFDCSLTSITIPSSVSSIGLQAFFFIGELQSAIFENPDGWWVTDRDDERQIPVEIMGLDDPATAARYLRDTYSGNHTWTRK